MFGQLVVYLASNQRISDEWHSRAQCWWHHPLPTLLSYDDHHHHHHCDHHYQQHHYPQWMMEVSHMIIIPTIDVASVINRSGLACVGSWFVTEG